ncbi:hypothetical protein ACTWQF_12810 [Streptomyces sp. 8N114]|uniref:hypothetical protein n=1 Tax=Streptomyces sp. 8N114 TaxID=3457419 RepID=UPI003FD048B7
MSTEAVDALVRETFAGDADAAYRCLGRALREPPARSDRPAVVYEPAAAALRSEAPAATVHHLRAALVEPACEEEPRLPALRALPAAAAGKSRGPAVTGH